MYSIPVIVKLNIKHHILLLSMLKTAVPLSIFVETLIQSAYHGLHNYCIFKDLLLNRNFKENFYILYCYF